jgi:hypothetical protein
MTTRFDPETAAAILDLVADGIGLKGACDRLGLARRSVRDWARTVPEFAAALRAARREGFEVWADEILSIGDEVAGCTDTARVQAARVRIDSRKWLLAKLRPEQFGDRVELTGQDGKDLIPQNTQAQIPRLMKVLAVLLPEAPNSELFDLATAMTNKLNGNGLDALPMPEESGDE